MKITFKLWQRNPDKFAAVAEDGERLANDVSPELAEWIRAAAKQKPHVHYDPDYDGGMGSAVLCHEVIIFGALLTEDTEIEL